VLKFSKYCHHPFDKEVITEMYKQVSITMAAEKAFCLKGSKYTNMIFHPTASNASNAN
jgi:hypothetical protein